MIYSRFFKNEIKDLIVDLFYEIEKLDLLVGKVYCNQKIFNLIKDEVESCEWGHSFWGADLIITEGEKIKVINRTIPKVFPIEIEKELEYNFKVAILKKINLLFLDKLFFKKRMMKYLMEDARTDNC